MSIETLIKVAPLKVEEVDIGGAKVFIRSLNGACRSRYVSLVNAKLEKGYIDYAAIVSLGLCDASGKLCGDWRDEQYVRKLDEIDGAVLEELCIKIARISGLSASEEAEKN